MEDDLGMIQTNLATDQMLEPAEQEVEEKESNPVQVLYLTNNLILIAEIDEVLADIGQPDCKLINPCVVHGGTGDSTILTKWMSDVTSNREMFMSSDKILTLVDPTPKLLDDYFETIR